MSKEIQSPSSTSQLRSEHLTINIEHKPGCVVAFNVSVSKEASNASWEKALKKINKEVSIPGFRPGKAPSDYVLKNYASFIEKEWKELLLDVSFQEALTLSQIHPFNKNSVRKAEVTKASREGDSSIFIEFESFPTLPTITASSIELHKKNPKEITEEDVENGIHDFSLHHAKWHEQEREIKEGDFVELTIQNLDDPLNPFLCKKTRFQVAPKKMGAWMKKLLIGKKANDEVEGVSEKSENESFELIDMDEFKPTKCLITIHKVLEAELPPLDDELAKKGGVETVEILRTKMKELLVQREEERIKNMLRNELEDILVKNYPFEIPESLIHTDVKNRLDAVLKHNPQLDRETMKKQIKEEAKDSYRLLFLLQSIANEKGLKVEESEYMQRLIQMFSDPSQNMASLLQDPAAEESLRTKLMFDLLNEKALDCLLDDVCNK